MLNKGLKRIGYPVWSVFISVFLVISLCACTSSINKDDINKGTQSAAQRLAEIEDRVFREAVTADSLSFHMSIKNPDEFGIAQIEPTWGRNYTQDYFEEECRKNQKLLEELAEIDINALPEEKDRVLYKTLKQDAELGSRAIEYYYYDEPFHTMDGMYIEVPLMMAEYEFRRQSDIDTYITLMKIFGEYIGRELDYEKEKAGLGLFMPDFVLDQVMKLCEGVLNNRDKDRHYLVDTFHRRIDAAEWLDDRQKEQYKAENRQVLTQYFFPVYDTIMAELSSLRGSGGAEVNDAQKQYYLLLLEQNTSAGFTPEDIIKLAEDALERSLTQMMTAVSNHPNVTSDYESGALSKGSLEENIAYLKSIAPTVFPELPDHTLAIGVLPESMAFIGAGAYYLIPPVDDYVNNTIRVNPRVAGNSPSLLSILAHESYGGHLLDYVYNNADVIGNLRHIMYNVCYSEGLAQYGSARLLLASDFDKPLIDLALSESALNFALFGRIEIGIYYEGWTVHEVSGLLQRTLGHRGEDANMQALYEQLYATKSVYVRYGAGGEFFHQLREAAEAKQGSSFNEKEFHTRLMDIGCCPLNVLAEMMENPSISE
ncbi:MAG: DUF885 domain-containing protein [Peptococcaceae bacterium]|nr:DUF885 domain-containing protein [Peptococcaceae bacterium]